ncbi:hypothetical protein AO067_15640 [Pseudomonas viridiflava ICMP 13104]|uniref:Insecticidal toxin protein n=1 Tax=Pseudomonas viridiflava ICMP 13104 TaxID=1198305 RepID=A0A0W0HP22_PSEVI|nr:hypothetical protein AO067_15640 [Pseudomonas viridiflava ICMP 13104]
MNSVLHNHTPLLDIIDPRALAVRSVQFYRNVAGQSATALVTHQRYDWAGRPVVFRDPRLFSRSENEVDAPANLVGTSCSGDGSSSVWLMVQRTLPSIMAAISSSVMTTQRARAFCLITGYLAWRGARH